MTEHSTVLSKGRKKRAMPATLATPEDIGGFALLGSHPLHKTSKVPFLGPYVAHATSLLQPRNMRRTQLEQQPCSARWLPATAFLLAHGRCGSSYWVGCRS